MAVQTARGAPLGEQARVEALDVTRGAAVLGILLMNIWAFAGPQAIFDYPLAAAGQAGAPVLTWAVINTLFEGSQRALFSLLFGAGMLLMIQRLEAAGPALRPGRIYYRRIGLLILIALFDAFVLLWPADILLSYALCGLLLYPLRRLNARWLLLLAVLVMALSAGLRYQDLGESRQLAADYQEIETARAAGIEPDETALQVISDWERIERRARPDLSAEDVQESIRITSSGSFGEFYIERATTSLVLQLIVAPRAWYLDALAVMLLGMAALRAGLLTLGWSTRALVVMTVLGYAIGLPLSFRESWILLASDFDPLVARQLLLTYDLQRLGLAAGHLGLLLLLCRAGAAAGVRRRLAAAGRMALSNYLMHSLLCGLIFYTVGLGLYGRFTGYYLYIVVALVWALQLYLSPWWLARYRFGPAEWLWRSLTYGQRQPLRR